MKLKKGSIELQKLKEEDLELLMSWRSNSEVYRCFYQQDAPLKWNEHYTWWTHRTNREDFIIIYNGEFRKRKIGTVNITHLDTDYPEIGILIGEISFWGKGAGKNTLKLALEFIKNKAYKGAQALILDKNQRSQELFKNMGFIRQGKSRNGESKYRIEF
ncbi:MAG: GNAT family N-acetyltransferase [Candidatus Lokiarchaeota archaeon]|nr:GNAT family N-acetyltransferase [Candidatus Lokiarchaeota archaeon]